MIQRTLHHLRKLPDQLRSQLSEHLISPRAVLQELQVAEGETVFELGNPTGFFAAAALGCVGQSGRVIVAGPHEESFDRIASLGERPQLQRVLLADVLMNRAFDHHSADWIMLTNLLSSSIHPDQFCLALDSYLKPSGRIVLLDWKLGQTAGPEQARRVSREEAVKLLSSCGMEYECALHMPGYHYGLVFKLAAKIR